MSEIRSNIIKVSADHQNRCVIAGDKVINNPQFLKRYTEIPHLLNINVKGRTWGRPMRGNKEFNKDLSEKLGMPPKQWMRVYNAVARQVWIVPIEHYVKKLAIGFRGKLSIGKVEAIWRNKEILEQASRDGIENVTPILLSMGCTPKEAKEMLGRSTWKKVANNSFHRNKLLVNHFYRKSEIKGIDLPSTALKHPRAGDDSFQWAVNHRDCYLKNYSRLVDISYMYRDTARMADKLGERFNPEWSLSRMQEEHDRLSKAITQQKYGTDPFDHHKEIGDINIEHQGWTATWLKSPYEIALEGNSMRHCVASYIRECRDEEYFIFSITDESGEKYSTLGVDVFQRNQDKRVETDQHLRAMNQRVKDERALNLEKKVREELLERVCKYPSKEKDYDVIPF